jgi:hypothetical protein
MPHRRLIAPVGLTALLGFAAVSPLTATLAHASGPQTCHLSESGHCVVPPSDLGVVDTPAGPVVLGAEALSPVVAYITHLVSTATSGTCVTTCQIPSAQVNTAAAANVSTDANTASADNGGYTSGGCASNSSCNSLRLYWHQTAYWGNNQASDEWQGAVSFNDLWPTAQGGNNADPNNEYDFMSTLATPSSHTWSVCSVRLTFASDSSASSPIDWWPRGSSPVSNGGSQTIGLSGSYQGAGVSYSSSFPTSQGWIEGDMTNPNDAPNFTSNWSYQNQNGDGASDCNWNTVALDGGMALVTPVGTSFTMSFDADGTGYEGT